MVYHRANVKGKKQMTLILLFLGEKQKDSTLPIANFPQILPATSWLQFTERDIKTS